MFSNDMVLRLPIVLIFGLIGYFLAKHFRSLHNQYVWFLLLGTLVVLSFVGNDPWLLTLANLTIPLKTLLSGALIGVLVGFAFHRQTTKK